MVWPLKRVWVGAIALTATGCGSGWHHDLVTAYQDQQTPAQNSSPVPEATIPVKVAEVPIETFLVGGALPATIRGSELRLTFRSNYVDAQFECRHTRRSSFRACASPLVDSDLVHGKAYDIAVRARVGSKIDRSPLRLSFMVDQNRGQPAATRARRTVDLSPEDLPPSASSPDPSPAVGRPDDENPMIQRALQVGSFYALTVPYEMVVTSFSTTKTLTGGIRMFRLLGSHAGSAYPIVACDQGWEREAPGAKEGTRYCDGTPTRTQLAQKFSRPMPLNHIEVVLGQREVTNEKLLVAAFDDEVDPAEGYMGISDTCVRGTRTVSIPVLNRYFHESRRPDLMKYCRVRDRHGRYWWLGTISTQAGPARLRITYAVSAEAGIRSDRQFAQRTSDLMGRMIVPLAPLPE